MHKLTAVLLLALPLASPPALADAASRINDYLRGLNSLRAEFTQVVTSSEGRVIERAAGTLMLAKPGRFHWDYRTPDQLIVSDGDTIWLYDRELGQVIVRAAGDTLAQTPAALLAGRGDVLAGYEVSEGDPLEGLSWSVLRPREGGGDFQDIRLGFRGKDLVAMALNDRLGQRTLLRFEKVERNPRLPNATFRFMTPPGVDVIGSAAP